MAKVEMSLNEYNEMRDELLLYKDLLKKLTTASVDTYYYQRIVEGTLDSMTVRSNYEDLTTHQKNLLQMMVEENFPGELKGLVDSGEYVLEEAYSNFSMSLCEIRKLNSEEINETF